MVLIYLLFLLYFILSSSTTTTTVKNVTVVKNSKEHYDLCKISYGQRNYITFDLNKLAAPPLLTSLPGSGNSWTRLLIEYATGYYTGSIYGDTTLFELFPGEVHCGKRLSVIKVHPGNLIITRNTNEGPIWINHKYSTITCKRGMIKGFNRMLLIIRDPWRTIFSEFVRRQSAASNIQNKMHNTTLTKSSFDERNWIRQAIMQAFEATQFWNKQFPELEKTLLSNLQVFRYEDLLDEDTRIDTLRNIIRFINITNDITTERLECAFLLGDSPTIHRNMSSEISINEVYGDSRLACQLDTEFRKLKVYQRFGYKLTTWNNTDCSMVRSYIKNVDEWIYAVNSSIFDVMLKTGSSDFIKNCKTVPDARNRYGAINCHPNVVPS